MSFAIFLSMYYSIFFFFKEDRKGIPRKKKRLPRICEERKEFCE